MKFKSATLGAIEKMEKRPERKIGELWIGFTPGKLGFAKVAICRNYGCER